MEQKPKSLLSKLFEFRNTDIEILKSKEAFGYSYATLDVVHKAILPVLKELKIGFYHTTGHDAETNQPTLTTILYNVENEDDRIESTTIIDDKVVLAKMNKFMVIGSAMTYFRRYHLSVMLGLLTDEDSDAGGAKTIKQKKQGKAIEEAKSDGPNFVAIFDNLIKKGKTLAIIEKSLSNYAKQMTDIQHAAVTLLISEHFNKK